MDYHYDFSPRDVQHAVFRAQLQLDAGEAEPRTILAGIAESYAPEAWR